VHATLSHWLHEISISKIIRHHFWPRLMVGVEFWGHMLMLIFFSHPYFMTLENAYPITP
jgi:hypothetical protein